MPKVSDAARATVKDGAVWRECPCCDQLRPLPPDVMLCDDCATPPTRPAGSGAWSR
jgi:hypothetical protein